MIVTVRLDRLVANRGGGSRAQVRKLIRRGRVTVNGSIVRSPRLLVAEAAEIEVDGRILECVRPPLAVVYHKPIGVVSSMGDPQGRPSLATEPDWSQFSPAWPRLFHPVGRLDIETSGLLLFSSRGSLTQRLLHPRRRVEREYDALVTREPSADLTARLAAGVMTSEGKFVGRVVAVRNRWVRLVVHEGRHRMVRRMLANGGHPVERLTRIRFGEVRLEAQPEGALRAVSDREAAWLGGLLEGEPTMSYPEIIGDDGRAFEDVR